MQKFPIRPECFKPLIPETPSYKIRSNIAAAQIIPLERIESPSPSELSFQRPANRNIMDKTIAMINPIMAESLLIFPEGSGLSGLFNLSFSISVMSL